MNPISTQAGRSSLDTISQKYLFSVKTMVKECQRSYLPLFINCISDTSASYLVTHAIIRKLMTPGDITYGSVVGAISDNLTNEWRLRQKDTPKDPVGNHFRKSREKLWVKIKRLKRDTEDLDPVFITKMSMTLLELFLRTFEGDEDLVSQRLVWNRGKALRYLELHPEVVRVLSQEDPVVPLDKPLSSPEPPKLIKPSRGPIACDVFKHMNTAWNTYRVSEELSAHMGNLKGLEPNMIFPWIDPIPVRGTKAEQSLAYRKEMVRQQKLFLTKSSASLLVPWAESGGPLSFPLSLDFRGRVYMSTLASPQFCKSMRYFLRSPEGEEFDWYDMKQSNLALLKLLTQGSIGKHEDAYLKIVDHLMYQWTGTLEEVLGKPSRDLAKDWYKALWFGQTMIGGYNQAIRAVIQDGAGYSDALREDLKQAYYSGWKFAEALAPLITPVKREAPVWLTLDDMYVCLSYRKTAPRKLHCRLYGQHIYMVIQETTEAWALRKYKTAFVANLIHTLDAWIMRRQLAYLGELGVSCVPIHDCLGLPKSFQGFDRLSEIVRETVVDFIPRISPLTDCVLTEYVDSPGFHTLYEIDNDHLNLSSINSQIWT